MIILNLKKDLHMSFWYRKQDPLKIVFINLAVCAKDDRSLYLAGGLLSLSGEEDFISNQKAQNFSKHVSNVKGATSVVFLVHNPIVSLSVANRYIYASQVNISEKTAYAAK